MDAWTDSELDAIADIDIDQLTPLERDMTALKELLDSIHYAAMDLPSRQPPLNPDARLCERMPRHTQSATAFRRGRAPGGKA